MSKVDIAGMIASKTAPAAPVEANAASTTPTAATTPTPARRKARPGAVANTKPAATKSPSKPPAAPKAEASKAAPDVQPKWRQCEPQTIYMWPNDIDALKDLARQLQRAKDPGVGERITMATLVRVAVSDLLRNQTHLDGTTEAELLESLRKF